jgi:hypothetical protein
MIGANRGGKDKDRPNEEQEHLDKVDQLDAGERGGMARIKGGTRSDVRESPVAAVDAENDDW